ncbi:putative cAMP-dependent protein kinase regulatory subunit [Cryptosporidium serpentis]
MCPCSKNSKDAKSEQIYVKEQVVKKCDMRMSSKSDSGSDSDIVDHIPIPKNLLVRGPRTSVSAEAYGAWNKIKPFTPPHYPKSKEQEDRIRVKLLEGFMFNSLDDDDLMTIIRACVETVVSKDTVIINQGDDGDKLYIIEKGQVDCFKEFKDSSERKHLCNLKPGDAFGELALLYNCPRAATVIASSDCLLWALDRETFNHIVKGAAAKRIETYEAFLKEVDLLKTMDPYELNKLAMVLKSSFFNDSDIIIKQGDTGDVFFLVISGEAVAIKDNQKVMTYKRGDYFGELALLRNTPRAATVKSKGKCKVAYLDRKAFMRLLGPVEEILKRNIEKYNLVMQNIKNMA